MTTTHWQQVLFTTLSTEPRHQFRYSTVNPILVINVYIIPEQGNHNHVHYGTFGVLEVLLVVEELCSAGPALLVVLVAVLVENV